jgi:hypothetical protein
VPKIRKRVGKKSNGFMKKYCCLTCVIILCALSSCSKVHERKERELFVQDSIRTAQLMEKMLADSLENARIDSLSLIAWGQTKFGMSLEEALNTETCKKSKTIIRTSYGNYKLYGPGYIEIDQDDRHAFMEMYGFDAGLSEIELRFSEDELSRVILTSYNTGISSVRTDDLIYDIELLTRLFTNKYGEPTTCFGKLSSYNFENEYQMYARWNIKDKVIYIWFYEDDSYRRSYGVEIINRAFPKKKHVETPEEKAEKAKQKEQEEFIKNNTL